MPAIVIAFRRWAFQRSEVLRLPVGGCRLRLLAVGAKLLEIGDDIVDVVILGQTREDHFGAGDLGAGIFEIFLQGRFIQGDAGIFVGIAVGVVGISAGL